MIFSFKKIFYATAFSTLLAGSAFADAVTVVSWGGSYGKAQDAALFTDASKDSGIAINRESGASMSKVMLQVESGAVIWDLVVTGSGGAANAAKNGALEKIDFNVVDVSNFLDNTYTDYCIGSDVFATVVRGILKNMVNQALQGHLTRGLTSGMWKSILALDH